MKKRSLNRMIALPLVAVAITCAADDLNAAGCAGTYQPYGSYSNYGNYQNIGSNSQGMGSSSILSPNMPSSSAYASQGYGTSGYNANYQNQASTYSNAQYASSNYDTSGYAGHYPGFPSQNPWYHASPNVNIGQTYSGQYSSGPYAGPGMNMGQGFQGPYIGSQGASSCPATGACPTRYLTGYSANYFDTPSMPVNSNANYALYGTNPSADTILNANANAPQGAYSFVNPNINAGSQGQPYSSQTWSSNSYSQPYSSQGSGSSYQQGSSGQNWNAGSSLYSNPSYGSSNQNYNQNQNYSCPGASGSNASSGRGNFNYGISNQAGYGYSSMNGRGYGNNLNTNQYSDYSNGDSATSTDQSDRGMSLFSNDNNPKSNNPSSSNSSANGRWNSSTGSYSKESTTTTNTQSTQTRTQQYSQPQQLNMPVVDILANNPQFSNFFRLLQASGELSKLQGAGPFTVFAPTNEAFNSISQSKLQDWTKPENRDKLKAVIDYHIVSGRYLANDLKKSDLKTLSNDTLDISGDAGNFKIDDARIVMPNLVGTNGVVHGIDHVLTP